MNERKSPFLKSIAGTERKDRPYVPTSEFTSPLDLKKLVDIPPYPQWMVSIYAREEWDRLCELLINTGMLTSESLSSLAQLCALHGKVVQIWAAGETPPMALVNQLRLFLNDFGLSPHSVGKIKVPKKDQTTPTNPFSRNGSR